MHEEEERAEPPKCSCDDFRGREELVQCLLKIPNHMHREIKVLFETRLA